MRVNIYDEVSSLTEVLLIDPLTQTSVSDVIDHLSSAFDYSLIV
jgi:hypothetical protein